MPQNQLYKTAKTTVNLIALLEQDCMCFTQEFHQLTFLQLSLNTFMVRAKFDLSYPSILEQKVI